nr:transcriptional repressor [Alcaligenes faecalis]
MSIPHSRHYVAGTAAASLRAAGVSVTMPRLAVWMVLEQAQSPLLAVDVARSLLRQGLQVPLSSVYAALRRPAHVRLIQAHAFEGGKAHYALASRRYNQRITCQDTGHTVWPGERDGDLTQAIAQFCRKNGFELSQYTLSVQATARPASSPREPKLRIQNAALAKHVMPEGDQTHEDEVPAVLFGAG